MKKEKKIGYVIEHESRGFLKDSSLLFNMPRWTSLDNKNVYLPIQKKSAEEGLRLLLQCNPGLSASAIKVRELHYVAKPIYKK